MRRVLLCFGDVDDGLPSASRNIVSDFAAEFARELLALSDVVCLFGGREGTIAERVVKHLSDQLTPTTAAGRIHTYLPINQVASELPEGDYVRYGTVVHAGDYPEHRREALVRDSDIVLLLGTGRGISEMARLANELGRFLVPVPLAGGPAVIHYAALMRRPRLPGALRAHLSQLGATGVTGAWIANCLANVVSDFYSGIVGRPQVFLAMPFLDAFAERDEAERAARNICEKNGLELYVCRDTTGEQPVISEVLEQIDASAVLLAYLDLERPNVYLEAGYAWGRRKPTILCLRTGQKIAFDVSAHEFLSWREIHELKVKLDKRIKTLIEQRVVVAFASRTKRAKQ